MEHRPLDREAPRHDEGRPSGRPGSTYASRPPVDGPPHGTELTHGRDGNGYAAFLKSVFARVRASTGQRLHRDEDLQHFFLTLPAFISLRTLSAGDFARRFLPTHTLQLTRRRLRLG